MSEKGLIVGEDGRRRCAWHGNLEDYRRYHDSEWGRPVTDDFRLFEKICLEGFQSGLSWLTILRKRESFRAAFAGFDYDRVAAFGDDVQPSCGSPLQFHEVAADRRIVRRVMRDRGDLGRANRDGDVLTIQQHAVFAHVDL